MTARVRSSALGLGGRAAAPAPLVHEVRDEAHHARDPLDQAVELRLLLVGQVRLHFLGEPLQVVLVLLHLLGEVEPCQPLSGALLPLLEARVELVVERLDLLDLLVVRPSSFLASSMFTAPMGPPGRWPPPPNWKVRAPPPPPKPRWFAAHLLVELLWSARGGR
jgi:hypothetical protein